MRVRYSAVTPILFAGLVLAAAPPAQPQLVVKPDAFPTLVNPSCSHCRDEAKRRASELSEKDPVLCWIRGKYDGGAIPIRFFLNPYRVISDTYGVFVYDPDAGYARGYEASLDFTFHGWRNGIMVMKHKDGTLYSCLSGVAFDGPKKGSRLQPIPTFVSQWGFWLEHYPGTVAYQMYDKYQPRELPAHLNGDSTSSRGTTDTRLAQESPILGVTVDGSARAYPLEAIEKAGTITDTLPGRNRKTAILWYAPTRTAVAFDSMAQPPAKDAGSARSVTLESSPANAVGPFRDKETGSDWDITGRAVGGALKGWSLPWLDSTQVKWFAWAAEYPQSTIFGK